MQRLAMLVAFVLLFLSACDQTDSSKSEIEGDSLSRIQKAGVLLWGADVIGGVPYVYEDSDNPGNYIGFEVDIAHEIARSIGVKATLVIKAWDTLIPELQRGSFDLALNGIEDTEDRKVFVDYSLPYYVYAQQITVRKETVGINNIDDLKGKAVATLSGTAAEDILRSMSDITVTINPEIIYSYEHLLAAKVDAVVLDTPIAAAYGASNPNLKNVGKPFGEGHYVIAFRKEDNTLLEAVNRGISEMKENGTMTAIYKKWGIMNQHQSKIGIK